jgi:hypothetical protein
MDRARVWALAVVLCLAVAGVAFVVAAGRYPGGTWTDRTRTGHALWGNYLCDLTRDPALDGRPNPGADWGRAAEWALVAAAAAFWLAVPALSRHRRLAAVVRGTGLVSSLGLALLPVTGGWAHTSAVVTGAVPGLLAAGGAAWALRHRPLLGRIGVATLVLATLDLGLYLGSLHGPALPAVPFVQRLALLGAAAWMGGAAWAVLRPQDVAGSPSSTSAGSPRAT